MKRVFIIHGWGGHPGEHWVPWLKRELEASNFKVIELSMPDTDKPVIEKWVDHLTAAVGELDVDTYFVGHSIGCQAILRYLETQVGKNAGGCVFVAGWFKLDNLDKEEVPIAEPWLQEDIDLDKILHVTTNFIVINSSNDDYGYVQENKKLFEEKLSAKVVILENKGHFTEDDGVTQLPQVLNAIQEITNQNN